MIKNKEFLDLILEIGLLKKIQRTGWVLKGVKDVESVAEHTWRVAIFALLFAKDLRLDELKTVKMALVHDLGEVSIGDIKWERGARVIASQEAKHQDEAVAVRKMFADNPSFQEYLDLWQEFNRQKTKEAKAVKEFDKLEMIVQALEYQNEGYPKELFDEFWENGEKYLKNGQLKEVFAFLKSKRETS